MKASPPPADPRLEVRVRLRQAVILRRAFPDDPDALRAAAGLEGTAAEWAAKAAR